MRLRNALILYGVGITFAVWGYFNNTVLGLGWATLCTLAVIGAFKIE